MAKKNEIDTDLSDALAAEKPSPPARVAAVPAPRQAPKPLPGFEIQPKGVKWQEWGIMARIDDTIRDVLDPGYLFAKHEQFATGHTIEIKHPLNLFVVVLDVVAVDIQAKGLVCYIRHVFDYSSISGDHIVRPTLDDAQIKSMGARGWAVVTGHHVVRDGFLTEGQATEWLNAKRKAA